MKNLISIALITLCCCCIENNLQKNIYLNYKLILLAPTEDSSSVAFKRDAVFILHRYSEEKKAVESYYDWYKVKAENEWSSVLANTDSLPVYYNHQIIQSQKFDSVKISLGLEKKKIFFSNILKPCIKYAEGKSIVIDSFKNKLPDCNKILFQKSGSYNFYTCTGLDNPIFIYDDNDKLVYTYKLDETYSIRDFFLYDITGDSKPELVLILNSPMSGIEKMVEIRIYSQWIQ